MLGAMSDHRNRSFWEERWARGETGWQLGAAAPPLLRILDEERTRLAPGKIAVLGCGRSHEPLELARRGFRVVGVDFAPAALAPLVSPEGPLYVAGDVRRLPLRSGSQDYILEQTCYCAIDPGDRPAYVREATRILRRGGRLVGLFFEPAQPGNPPFATTQEQIRDGFSGSFEIERLEKPGDSVGTRTGREWLALMKKR
jgi:SAM-dependent methyltransferase